MEYSTQQLAKLAGVTTRTLRWYDKIGLLKPSRTSESGYRYYGPAEVDRLQDILYYRALGVELAQIQKSLDDPSFNRLEALKSHLSALEAEKSRIQSLIASVKETILSTEREEIMNDELKFQAFKQRAVEENEKRYGYEVRQKYGDREMDQANETVLGLTKEQYREWSELGTEIQAVLENAVKVGSDPCGEEGRRLTDLHRRWLSVAEKQYDVEKHRGLAELYITDERFLSYYDKNVIGCAKFLRDSVWYWAEKL